MLGVLSWVGSMVLMKQVCDQFFPLNMIYLMDGISDIAR